MPDINVLLIMLIWLSCSVSLLSSLTDARIRRQRKISMKQLLVDAFLGSVEVWSCGQCGHAVTL